jgi:hypothetical protein
MLRGLRIFDADAHVMMSPEIGRGYCGHDPLQKVG